MLQFKWVYNTTTSRKYYFIFLNTTFVYIVFVAGCQVTAASASAIFVVEVAMESLLCELALERRLICLLFDKKIKFETVFILSKNLQPQK